MLKSRRYEVTNSTELKDVMNDMAADIETQIELKQFNKSGLRVHSVDKLTVHYDRYNPTRGGSYIELPDWIKAKKACINIKNEDNRCFKVSVQCGVHNIHLQPHPERMSHYNKLKDDVLDWQHMKYPAGDKDVDRFEENNPGVISVNVYEEMELNGKQAIVLRRRTKVINAKYHVNLLKISDGNGKFHYVYIKDYDKLVGKQTNGNGHKLHHCRYCQHGFKHESTLKKHLERGCLAVEGQSVELPMAGSTIGFSNHTRKFKTPYVMFADFECLTTKTGCYSKPIKANEDDANKPFTKKYQKHTPSGFMILVVDDQRNIVKTAIYRGADCMDVFCKTIREIENELVKTLLINKPIEMTEQDLTDFENATECHICDNAFGTFKADDKCLCKVRDHNHLTGKFRGAAHSCCNIHYNYKDVKIPVFFHNLKNYDAHLIISNAHALGKKKIDVIAQNSEKFISFGYDHLVFKDSFSFLSSSLDKLAKLNKYKEIDGKYVLIDNWMSNFKYSRQNPNVKNDEDLHLATDKGVYPYDYMNCWERFDETQLPPKDEFYSLLSESGITDKDYERACDIWKQFNIENLGQYHDFYLMSDVYLLADVFENFRDMCFDYYGLDPAYYYTLPNFAWDAMLKKTKVKMDQLSDLDMYQMIETGLRGGMCQVSQKHMKANNKYMTNYNEDIITSYIMYLDANNLYGGGMSEKLPYADFQWSDDIRSTEDVLNYENGDYGYFLEVDLHYPEHLHDLHCDYPLAPENTTVSADMVSEFSKGIYSHYHAGKPVKDEGVKKLILSVRDKRKYVVHIRNLKYYLEKGLVMTQVHRCVKFKQTEWLKPWIDFNTEKRKESTNDFHKDLFKLMNNAVFGKTMENVREHVGFELVSNVNRLEKCVNSPTFKNKHFINESLLGIEKIKQVVKLNKPIFAGFAILELSKLHMYNFHYEVLKPKYGDNVKLGYTDTDSFVIHVYTEDVYEDFKQINQHMDFSDYPKDHPNYDPTNKKKLGKFKDEMNGKIITEFIGLKPKMYSFTIDAKHDDPDTALEYKKAKGVPKHKVKRALNFENYRKTLQDNANEKIQFNSIRSYQHQLFSITCNKQGLSNYDNKRYYFNNNESYPHGHYRLNR